MRVTDRSEPAEPVPNYRAFTWLDLRDSCRVVARVSHRCSVCSVEGGQPSGQRARNQMNLLLTFPFFKYNNRRLLSLGLERHQEEEKDFNGKVEVW